MFGMARLYLFGGIAAALVAAAVAFGWWSYTKGQNAEKGRTAAAEGRAAVAEGQARAAGDAAVITNAGVVRERIIERTHETNRETILAAPGAGQALDPELVRRARVGLCQHAAYADSVGCVELLRTDSEQLPRAGAADAAPAG
jgi:hypothetical protein